MKERVVPLSLEQIASKDAMPSFPVMVQLVLNEEPPPRVQDNLQKLQKLGLLGADVLLSIVGQAPIDPVNLAGTLKRLIPDGWVFSPIDFAIVRAIGRDERSNAIIAVMHVDLMGDTIKFLAMNQADQLTIYKEYQVKPSPTTWDEVQALIHETVGAAKRETKS